MNVAGIAEFKNWLSKETRVILRGLIIRENSGEIHSIDITLLTVERPGNQASNAICAHYQYFPHLDKLSSSILTITTENDNLNLGFVLVGWADQFFQHKQSVTLSYQNNELSIATGHHLEILCAYGAMLGEIRFAKSLDRISSSNKKHYTIVLNRLFGFIQSEIAKYKKAKQQLDTVLG